MAPLQSVSWRKGFQRITWIISACVWLIIIGLAINKAIHDSTDVMAAAIFGSLPWGIYWLISFIIRGFFPGGQKEESSTAIKMISIWKYVKWLLLSSKGRASVPQVWASLGLIFAYLLLVLTLFELTGLFTNQSLGGEIFIACALLPIAWMYYSACAKRAHDLGLGAWVVLLGLVPIACLIIQPMLFFWPGRDGENKYGYPHGAMIANK